MAGFSIHFIRGFSLITWKMKFGLRASDGEIIQTPHPWVVGLPPLFPKISKICLLIFVPDRRVWLLLSTQRSEPNQQKQGNRLTRHPCKGDEFEIRILKAQRQNTCIWRTCEKRRLIWTFISTGSRVTQEYKYAFRLRGDAIFVFKG